MAKKKVYTVPVAQQSGTMWVYAVYCDRINGDSFDIAYSFDLAVARSEADQQYHHLTHAERSSSRIYIYGWQIPVNAGETAREAWSRWIDDMFSSPDPDFCEDYEVHP
jgi:hypothetical protein